MASRFNKRFVHDPETGKMVELPPRERTSGLLVMQDLQDFVSPVDGTVVHGRRGLREHDKKHRVTNVADFKNTWANAQAKRERERQGHDPRRLGAIIRAYDDLRDGKAKRKT